MLLMRTLLILDDVALFVVIRAAGLIRGSARYLCLSRNYLVFPEP